jgi:hypothetical protein
MRETRSGWVTFAGVMLLILGVLNIVYGIAAIDEASFFVNDTKFIFSDLQTWGWVALIVGVLQVFAAFSLWAGNAFGQVIGIATAGVSAIVALLSIPAYPFWSLAIFAVDVVIIHQIAVNGSRGRGVEEAAARQG